MTLEQESWKARGVPPTRPARRPTRFDVVARVIATLLLIVALTVIYWVPVHLLTSIGASAVLAILTLLGANLASRLHRLRQRVDALEETVGPAQAPASPPPPPDQK